MTLQASGQISIRDIAEEFGGVTQHKLSEYYSADTGVPASGQISLGSFYSKARDLRSYASVYQGNGSYGGFANVNKKINYTGTYSGTTSSYANGNSFYIGLPTGIDLFTYHWEQVADNFTTNSAGPHDFIALANYYTQAFATLPYYTQGGSGSTGDTQITFKLATGYTVSYYQQDQHGTGNDLARTGQTYTIWRGITVSGLSGVPGISGSGNGGSSFRIRRIS